MRFLPFIIAFALMVVLMIRDTSLIPYFVVGCISGYITSKIVNRFRPK